MKNLFKNYMEYHMLSKWNPKLFSDVLQNENVQMEEDLKYYVH